MTTLLKGYLLIIGLVSMGLGLTCMFMPDLGWYPAFEDIERGTAAASFVRTMAGVFVASGYVLIRFIFSSSKVQLGTVLIYLCSFMLIGKFSGLYYEGIKFHDIITTSLGTLTLIGLIVIHKHRKNLLNYDL
jgi:hypothetical protein|tara:strand:+ start:1406 stop:1801 length:396 start_codon:yes stop_codon:yes gene_type:complete